MSNVENRVTTLYVTMMHTLGLNGYMVGDSRLPMESVVFMQLLDIFRPSEKETVGGWDITLMSAYIDGWDAGYDDINIHGRYNRGS